jgi:hypothetical protein
MKEHQRETTPRERGSPEQHQVNVWACAKHTREEVLRLSHLLIILEDGARSHKGSSHSIHFPIDQHSEARNWAINGHFL